MIAPVLPNRPAQDAGRWRDLARRTASAAVLAPAAIACLWYGGAAWIAFVGLGAAGLAWEWARMLRTPVHAAATTILGIGLVLALLLRGAAPPALASGLLGVVLLHFFWFRRLAPALGLLVIGPPAIALIWLRLGSAGFANTLYLLLVVWASDIGAYLAGRLVGGPRLAPAISPGKTWAGAVGGLLGAGLAGWAAAAALAAPTNLNAFILASVLGLVAQLGDLAESALKRHCGVKDSGALIPGHGGVFDRLDALLAAATAMGLMAVTTGNGVVLWR
ncbi:MAG: phosphatidate cytidylyltransferase [Rhodospirillales bacterium]|nr:phosphatidate cytidylyltransferase [Rhodospirillales bacterium]